ncbi:RNA polymerase sigma factor [Nocardiopsis tropica]|uniref:Sigma-70 family RNA polymerase sigma factor n=1 Tax=Nocardiopsis tropica TaxID=109330 RepID=A0ABV1ZWE3_9ACTN
MNHHQSHPRSTSPEGETYPLEVLVDTAADIAAEFTMNRMSRADAEDAAAHAIDEARRALAAGKAIDHPRRWMHRVATRFHSKQVHKRERDVLTDDVDRSGVHVAVPGTAPEEALEIKEGTRLALDLLARLPAAQREAMVLHVLHGLERPEVARLLGISPKTVQKRLERARATLSTMGERRIAAALSVYEDEQDHHAGNVRPPLRKGAMT